MLIDVPLRGCKRCIQVAEGLVQLYRAGGIITAAFIRQTLLDSGWDLAEAELATRKMTEERGG
ncbi:MAG: hypothetical protein ACRENX_09655 [Candidatus Dormibacteria bacterium]